jgi:hypothetical protein
MRVEEEYLQRQESMINHEKIATGSCLGFDMNLGEIFTGLSVSGELKQQWEYL